MPLINRKPHATLIHTLCCLPKTMKWTPTPGQKHSGWLKHTEHKSTRWLSSPLPKATPLFTWQEWHTPRQGHFNISVGRRSCPWGGISGVQGCSKSWCRWCCGLDQLLVLKWHPAYLILTSLRWRINSLVSKAGSNAKSIYKSLGTGHFYLGQNMYT